MLDSVGGAARPMAGRSRAGGGTPSGPQSRRPRPIARPDRPPRRECREGTEGGGSRLPTTSFLSSVDGAGRHSYEVSARGGLSACPGVIVLSEET